MARANDTLVNGEPSFLIPVEDRGFAYGDGVFRTIRMLGGIPQQWQLHYQKLSADCAAIGIVCPSAEMLMSDMTRLFLQDALDDKTQSVAKIIITRGIGKRGYKPSAVNSPMRVVMKLSMPEYSEAFFSDGVAMRVCDLRLAIQPRLAGIKHLNRLENVLARMEWQDEQFFEGLLLDLDDHVIECTMSNIFCRFDDMLETPLLNKTGVDGITRQQILQVAKTLSLNVKETTMTLSRVLAADEVVICNSLFGVVQVNAINETTWPVMPLAARLRSAINYESN